MQLRTPTTKTTQALLVVFVIAVLIIDLYAVQQFSPGDESLGAAALTSRVSAATTTVPVRGKGFGAFLRELFGKKDVVTTPPTDDSGGSQDPDASANNGSDDSADSADQGVDQNNADDDVLAAPQDDQEENADDWATEDDPYGYNYEDPWQQDSTDDFFTAADTSSWTDLDATSEDSGGTGATEHAPASTRGSSVPKTARGTLPDLFVGEVSPLIGSLDAVQPNQPLALRIRIDNVGSKVAGPFSTRIRVDTGANGSVDEESVVAPQGVLPGRNAQRLTVLSAVKETVSGKDKMQICVDNANVVAESNEKNNCRVVDFTVLAGPSAATPKTSVVSSFTQAIANFFSSLSN